MNNPTDTPTPDPDHFERLDMVLKPDGTFDAATFFSSGAVWTGKGKWNPKTFIRIERKQ